MLQRYVTIDYAVILYVHSVNVCLYTILLENDQKNLPTPKHTCLIAATEELSANCMPLIHSVFSRRPHPSTYTR
jgi:hypothetical protein